MSVTLAAFLTVFALAFLAIKFGWKTIKRLIGMDWAVDIAVTVFFIFLFGFTGTISGMLTGIIAGLIVSVMLFGLRMVIPHQKLKKVDGKLKWVESDGDLVARVKEKIAYAA